MSAVMSLTLLLECTGAEQGDGMGKCSACDIYSVNKYTSLVSFSELEK
jgi:hypothetical protein